MDVTGWLVSIGLEQYAEAFRANEVDFEILGDLTADDLKEIGVGPVGHRRKLLEAIAALTASRTADVSTPSAVRSSQQEAERRHLTVMFVDLVGSTELSRRLDPEDMREVIRAYQNSVAGEVTRYEGHVAKYMGDGVLAYFGWPRAHEDEAERAVRAGLAIAAAVQRLPAPDGQLLQARIGVATGLVVVGDLVGEGGAQEEAVVGDTPNLAARLQGLAAAGTVVIAEATRRLVGQAFEVEDLGPQALKGIAGQTPAFRVLQERSLESRFAARQVGDLSPMVGRDQELGFLLERWQQAQSGEGQLVLLTGEAGIGKSRLTEALINGAGPQAQAVLRYQCSPYHADSPLYPVIQQISHSAKLAVDVSEAEKLDRVEALLAKGTERVGEAAPLMAALLGLESAQARYGSSPLTSQQRRARTLAVLVDQLRGLALRGPVLWVLEDAHWIDPTTLELIELALDKIGAARVLMLITARPTFAASFASHPVVTRLALNRLARAATQAIARRIAGGKSLPDALIDEIAARTDGVPLFVEEMVKAVLESGSLRETERAYYLDGPLSTLAVPTTLHDSLMARLDRLHGVKEVAQTASVIGRSFDHATLAAVAVLPDDRLTDALNRLVEAELVFRRGTPPDATYLFKHALVRDAAYNSILRVKRTDLHSRIARILENTSPQIVDSSPELIAQHYESGANLELATKYWMKAGKLSASCSAMKEASLQFERALAAIHGSRLAGTEMELDAECSLGAARLAVSGFSGTDTGTTFQRAHELWELIGKPDKYIRVLWGEWLFHANRGSLQRARGISDEMLEIGEKRNNASALVLGSACSGNLLMLHGEFRQAQDEFRRCLNLFNPIDHGSLVHETGVDPRVNSLSFLGFVSFILGDPDVAFSYVAEAENIAKSLSHLPSLAMSLSIKTRLCSLFGDHDLLEQEADRLLRMGVENGFPFWRAQAQIYRGWLRVVRGDVEEGLGVLREGLSAYESTGAAVWLPLYRTFEAEAELRIGQPDAAIRILDRVILEARERRELWFMPELMRRRARILPDQAVRELSEAVKLSELQGSKMWQLRARLDLLRLANATSGRGAQSEAARLMENLMPNWSKSGHEKAHALALNALSDNQLSLA